MRCSCPSSSARRWPPARDSAAALTAMSTAAAALPSKLRAARRSKSPGSLVATVRLVESAPHLSSELGLGYFSECRPRQLVEEEHSFRHLVGRQTLFRKSSKGG